MRKAEEKMALLARRRRDQYQPRSIFGVYKERKGEGGKDRAGNVMRPQIRRQIDPRLLLTVEERKNALEPF